MSAASPDLCKQVLGDVVDIFTNDIDMSETADNQDLPGRTYEYCIQQFAEKEGVGGGEFYTPASVVKTLFHLFFEKSFILSEKTLKSHKFDL